MLLLAVRVMNEYRVLLVKMSTDSKALAKDDQGKKPKTDKKVVEASSEEPRPSHRYSNFVGAVEVVAIVAMCPLPHAVLLRLQVCDYVLAIQICMAKLIALYIDDTTTFTQDIF